MGRLHGGGRAAQNAAAIPSIAGNRSVKRFIIASCVLALAASLFSVYFETQSDLRKSCASVAEDFTHIMRSYRHSFCLFEKLLQREILHAQDPNAIEAFLKEQDGALLEIEGGDYDGVYMYYQGRYLYSWNTPFSVYQNSGYDARTRPWYIGALAAKGEIFFSNPYPSYANDYMLATISRLQDDGETVIAYDIKLGEIGEYVDKLDLYDGALTLICDADANIIGCTDHRYQGGNYALTAEEMERVAAEARLAAESATDEDAKAKALQKAENAEAQRAFCAENTAFIERLLLSEGRLLFVFRTLSFGFAYGNGEYTCFVVAPAAKLMPMIALWWAALSFLLIAAVLLLTRMIGRNNQISTDGLTGLNNRRALVRYCDNHFLHRPDEKLCLIMLDLNNFKRINDRYGHVVGDRALLDAADALKKTCAEAAVGFFLCRYGGDEFLLAGAHCEPEDIARVREAIVRNLSLKNQTGKSPYALEASIGVACGKCADKSDLEKLLAQADKAMYAEKLRSKQPRARTSA